MSFRRNSSESHKWQGWLDLHKAELVEAGVPDWVLTDEFRWLRFLEHGYDHETGWSPSMLSADQAQSLQVFIRREYGDQRHKAVLRDIKVHLDKLGGRPRD